MILLYLRTLKENNDRKENYVLIYDITIGYSWEAKVPTQFSMFYKHY